jgi:glycerol-3-phosphate acyltransferase PlsY
VIEAGLFVLFTYLFGAVPTGPILATLYADVDITAEGSGNIGATNVHRVLGPRFGLATLFGDLAKGCVPVLLAPYVSEWAGYPSVVAVAAFAGHCWPAYLEFKGGKGVATAAGALMALAPFVALLTAGAWMMTFLLWRRSSLAALVAGGSLPILCVWLRSDLVITALILMVGLFHRHRTNIMRLVKGEEPTVERQSI